MACPGDMEINMYLGQKSISQRTRSRQRGSFEHTEYHCHCANCLETHTMIPLHLYWDIMIMLNEAQALKESRCMNRI